MSRVTALAKARVGGRLERRRNLRDGVGALVIGGDHPGLAIARSLGRRGIPVYILEDQHSISAYSRYATRVLRVKNLRDDDSIVSSVLEIGNRHDLRDWVLFPTRDEAVVAFSRHHKRLSQFFRVTTPEWETTLWAWDKRNTYKLAERLGIPAPRTWTIQSIEELPTLYSHLPLAIKPAIKEDFFYATGAKAWRVESQEQLHKLFEAATREIPVNEIMMQEIIPGDGESQFSYCAFFRQGSAHSSLVAKRMRQHPREFGRAATYVETTELPEIETLSQRFLSTINFYGIVEVEFKRDIHDGQYKLLDVNMRAWGFHGLGQAAGVDFAYLLFADQLGENTAACRGRVGVGWLRVVTDVPTAFSGMCRRHLSLSAYLQSIQRTKLESVFCAKDPLPFAAELLLLPYFATKKFL
jgi:D-aspartate ligase